MKPRGRIQVNSNFWKNYFIRCARWSVPYLVVPGVFVLLFPAAPEDEIRDNVSTHYPELYQKVKVNNAGIHDLLQNLDKDENQKKLDRILAGGNNTRSMPGANLTREKEMQEREKWKQQGSADYKYKKPVAEEISGENPWLRSARIKQEQREAKLKEENAKDDGVGDSDVDGKNPTKTNTGGEPGLVRRRITASGRQKGGKDATMDVDSIVNNIVHSDGEYNASEALGDGDTETSANTTIMAVSAAAVALTAFAAAAAASRSH